MGICVAYQGNTGTGFGTEALGRPGTVVVWRAGLWKPARPGLGEASGDAFEAFGAGADVDADQGVVARDVGAAGCGAGEWAVRRSGVEENRSLVERGGCGFRLVGRLDPGEVRGHTRVRIGYAVHICRVKNREWQDVDIYYENDLNLCSARAVDDLADALIASGHPSGPLFRRISKTGRVAVRMTRKGKPIGDPDGRLTVDAVTDILKRNFERAGESGDPSSHSLRHGLVKTALDAGAEPLDVKRHGHWNDDSTAFNRYVDKHDSRRRNPLKTISRAHTTTP